MANNLKEIDGILITDDTIPLSSTLTPTISATRESRTFTLSDADPKVTKGSWIYDDTNGSIYLVTSMSNDGKSGTIRGTFNYRLLSATVKVIPESDAKVIQMSIAADQDSVSSVNGVALASGTSKSWSTVGNGGDVGGRFVEPKIVLGDTDGNVSYIYTKY